MENKIEILKSIKRAVVLKDELAEVFLYGSRARGDEQADSDWDVLILTSHVVNSNFKREIRNQLFNIGLKYAACISSIILNKQDWNTKYNHYPLYYELAKDGIAIQ